MTMLRRTFLQSLAAAPVAGALLNVIVDSLQPVWETASTLIFNVGLLPLCKPPNSRKVAWVMAFELSPVKLNVKYATRS